MISIREMLKKFIYTFHPRNFSRNTGTKLVAVFIAIILWFFVMDQENPEQIKSLDQVPVQLINVEELSRNNLILMDQDDYYVNVKVKGRRNDLIDLNVDDINLSVDLVGYDQGVNSIYISRSTNSEDYEITELSDETIKVFLDKIVEVQKPVDIVELGEIPNGFVKEDMIIQPSAILVRGPESIVNAVDSIYGEVNVEGAEATIQISVPLQPIDIDGEYVSDVSLSNTYVDIDLPINKLKLMTVNPETTGVVAEGYKVIDVSVAPDQVLVMGPKDTVNDFLKLRTVELNLNGASQSFSQSLVLRLPEGVTSQTTDNKVMVSATIEKMETKEFRYNTQDIPTRNLSEGLETNISTIEGEIILQVTDVPSVLNTLKKDDFDIFVNVRDLASGEYELQLNVAGIEAVNGMLLEPNTLNVVISEILPETPEEETQDNQDNN